MTTSSDTPPPSKDAGAAEIEADIERTRADLGHTVEALTEKLDVKAQAQHKLDDVKQRATEQTRAVRERGSELLGRAQDVATDEQGAVTPPVVIGASVVAVVAVALLIWRSRR